LVQVLKAHLADEPHTQWECRSSLYYQNTALYPITDLFQRTLQFQADDTPEQRLEKLERTLSQYRLPLEESVALFASLLSLPVPEDRYPPLHLSPQRQRQKTLEAIVSILLEQAEQQPVLFILEDLHWTDPTTLEFLDLLIDQIPTTAICALLTCRPMFQPSWHHRSYLTEVTLNRLARSQIEQMAERVAGGKNLPTDVLQQIVEKTDGVPLFVEEMVKAVLESGLLKETDGHYELVGSLTSLAIPATLQDSLMARLDRLVTAKAVAQYAAVIGRQFSYALLQAVSELDEATLQRELGRLVEAELVYQRGLPPQATYMFKHALVQDAAYESLLKSTRQQYHQRIAQVLASQFLETVEAQPELLAHHYTEAGLHEQAVGYWQQAGENAIQRFAHVEAISHLTKGLALLDTLPGTPERAQQELTLHIALGAPLIATKGFAAPEVGQAYTRARVLCRQIGETPQLFRTLFGLTLYYLMRLELQTAQELGEQCLRLAQRAQESEIRLQAHHALWPVMLWRGDFVSARHHIERGMALYDTTQHHAHTALYGGHDPGACSRQLGALVLWMLGYPDQALTMSRSVLTLTQELAHPLSKVLAHNFAAVLHELRRESHAAKEQAETTMRLCADQGLPLWLAWGTSLRGKALTELGQDEEGVTQMRQGLAAWRATGANTYTHFVAMLAEGYGKVGQSEEGLTLLAEALAHMNQTEERQHEAELHRLKGELLLQQSADNQSEAEACFHQALDIARQQQARSWELRAATSLSRLWQQQGKHQDAYDLLAPVYEWFTEGFDTADLQEAKGLLEVLGDNVILN
jgi:predicted ATPase